MRTLLKVLNVWLWGYRIMSTLSGMRRIRWISHGNPMNTGSDTDPSWNKSNQPGVNSGSSIRFGGSSRQRRLITSPLKAVKAWSRRTTWPVPRKLSKRLRFRCSVSCCTMGSSLVMPAREK